MSLAIFADAALSTLRPRVWRKPSRCPYCPADAPPHWIRWGSYTRYAGDRENPSKRIAIPRCRCRIVLRTFSLPPDYLLPYWGVRTAAILQWLHALLVQGVGLNTLARQVHAARGTLRYLKTRFLRASPTLRLPRCEGGLAPAAFLGALADMEPAAVAAESHSSIRRGMRCGRCAAMPTPLSSPFVPTDIFAGPDDI